MCIRDRRYTTDGSAVTPSSTAWPGNQTYTNTTILRARAYGTGAISDEVTYIYTKAVTAIEADQPVLAGSSTHYLIGVSKPAGAPVGWAAWWTIGGAPPVNGPTLYFPISSISMANASQVLEIWATAPGQIESTHRLTWWSDLQ